MTKIPAYIQIKNSILQKIHSGQWREGMAIPSEVALAAQFQVSRMTVGRALNELREARILERRQGSGTYVAQQKYKNTRIDIHNIAEEIQARGHHYHAEVLLQEARVAHDELCTQLEVEEGCYLAHICVVHHENNRPVQFEDRWVNLALAPHFLAQDFRHVNPSAYLIENVALESGYYRIEAMAARADVAKALRIENLSPSLVLTRRTISQQTFTTFVMMWHPAGYQIRGFV